MPVRHGMNDVYKAGHGRIDSSAVVIVLKPRTSRVQT